MKPKDPEKLLMQCGEDRLWKHLTTKAFMIENGLEAGWDEEIKGEEDLVLFEKRLSNAWKVWKPGKDRKLFWRKNNKLVIEE